MRPKELTSEELMKCWQETGRFVMDEEAIRQGETKGVFHRVRAWDDDAGGGMSDDYLRVGATAQKLREAQDAVLQLAQRLEEAQKILKYVWNHCPCCMTGDPCQSCIHVKEELSK